MRRRRKYVLDQASRPERVNADAYPRKFEPGTEQTIALASVLPKKVAEFENETANRRYLKRSDDED